MLVSDLPTPALLVDRARLHANLDAMAARADAQDVALRPHVKTHKSPTIAQMQVDRGAKGLTVATVDEAEAFAGAGFDDLRLASPVVGPTKLDRLAALASTGTRISFTVDSARGVALASAAFSAAGVRADVLLEVDGGYGRCGVAFDDLPLAIDIAGRAAAADGLSLVGVLSHGGDAYAATGDDARRHAMDTERDRTLAVAQALVDAGLLDAVTAEVSVGSTPGATVFTNAPADGLRVTEIRPGTYALMDRMQVALGAARLQDCALVCVATVISKKRFDDGTERVITDAGKKVLTSDLVPEMDTFGDVLYSPRTMIAHPHAVVSALSEEHGWVDTPGGAIWDVSDPVFVIPNHACVAVATRRQLYLVDGDEVVETLDVVAR